jgi:hypothetical protein
VLNEFNETENFVSLAKDTKFIDYQNAQIILIGAKEGRDMIKNEIGVEIEISNPADISDKLKIRKDQVPIRPLTEGKLERYISMLLIIGNMVLLYYNTFIESKYLYFLYG